MYPFGLFVLYSRRMAREDGCGIMRLILEVERVLWVVERIKSRSNIYEGMEKYIDLWVIERSIIRDRFI